MLKTLAAFLMSVVLIAAPGLARGGGGHGGGHSRGGGHVRGGHTRSGRTHGSGHKHVRSTPHHSAKSKTTKTSTTTSRDTVQVNGYTTKKGTVVGAHDRTRANDTKNDNWSTKGNVNPETGKRGTKPSRRH